MRRQCQVLSARRVVGATTSWDSLFSDQEPSASSNSSWDIIHGPWTPPTEDPQAPAAMAASEAMHASVSTPEEGTSKPPMQPSETACDGAPDGGSWSAISSDAEAAAAKEWDDWAGDAEVGQADPGSWWEGLIDPEVGASVQRGP